MFRSFEDVYSKSPDTCFSYIKHNYLDLVRNSHKYIQFYYGGHYGSWESTCALIRIRQNQIQFRYKLEYARSWPTGLKDGSTKENKSPITLQRGWWGFLIEGGCWPFSLSHLNFKQREFFLLYWGQLLWIKN